MRTEYDCLPCILRQALDALCRLDVGGNVREAVIREVLKATAEIDFHRPPPAMSKIIHDLIRQTTGNPDPYREVKERQNRLALALYPSCRERVAASADPLLAALRLAAAGNVIDLGAKGGLDEVQIRSEIEKGFDAPLVGVSAKAFRQVVERAGKMLYIGDNAGEIVFDRILIEQIGPEKVTYAVRGGPIINDATRADAEAVGLCGMVEVVDSGSGVPGTILEDCGAEFRRHFDEADLILAKGQGNYETLSDTPADVFFLFKVKCSVVAKHAGMPIGIHVLARPRVSSSTSEPARTCREGGRRT
ncbi:MAG: ARMT1-like domain-containing protein [Planctomycetota bacterium]